MRLSTWLGIGALTLSCCLAPAAAIAAQPAAAVSPVCVENDGDPNSGLYSITDINYDALSDDVVGVPNAAEAGHAGAGAVDIHYGSSQSVPARTQRFDASLFPATGGPETNAAFGASVAFTHLTTRDDGGCADLLIGAPGANGGRGSVVIARGSNAGVTAEGATVLSGSSAGERFGSVVVADDDDLWIGAPDRTVDGAVQAGAIDHYRWANGTATLVQTLTESTPGVPGLAEAYDHFGSVLSIEHYGALVVGEPDEDVGTGARDAGTVTVVFTDRTTGKLTRARTFAQNSPGVPGTSEAGDHFGASVTSVANNNAAGTANIAVGVPGESLGRLAGAGTVDLFTVKASSVNPSSASALSQDSPGVPGADEAGDHLGQQVDYIGNYLCVSMPGEDLGSAVDTGRVLCSGVGTVGGPGKHGWVSYQQGSTAGGPSGSPQSGSALGTYLSRSAYSLAGDYFAGGESVVIGAPGVTLGGKKDVGAVFYDTGVTDSGGQVAGERYGVPAFTVSNGASYDTR
ncbi:hypothetical protein [uncultured Jatrophihabitans sp.]|uniref:hypothetical protein n=1 Tax=uncultured Jatrophihabitans sp. TaxID=1610747 RepID=UPI0035CB679C